MSAKKASGKKRETDAEISRRFGRPMPPRVVKEGRKGPKK